MHVAVKLFFERRSEEDQEEEEEEISETCGVIVFNLFYDALKRYRNAACCL